MAEDEKKDELGTTDGIIPSGNYPPQGYKPVTQVDGSDHLVVLSEACIGQFTLEDGSVISIIVPNNDGKIDIDKVVPALIANAEEKEEPEEDKDKGGAVGGVVPVPVGGGTKEKGDSDEPDKEDKPKDEPKKENEENKPKKDKKKNRWMPLIIGGIALGASLLMLFYPIKETYKVVEQVPRIETTTKTVTIYDNEKSSDQLVGATHNTLQEELHNQIVTGIGPNDNGESAYADEKRAVETFYAESDAENLIKEGISKINNGDATGLGDVSAGVKEKDRIYKYNAGVYPDMEKRNEDALHVLPDGITEVETESARSAAKSYSKQEEIANLNAQSGEIIDESLRKLKDGEITSIENLSVVIEPDYDTVLKYDEVKKFTDEVERTKTTRTNLWNKLVELFRRDRSQAESVKTPEAPKGPTAPGEPTKRVEPDGAKNTEEDERG